MESESEIFKYQKRRKIGEIITMVLIITFMVFILDSEGGEITKILLTILMTGFLVFMISYTYVLNENIELNSESLNINKKIGKSTKIKLDKIPKTNRVISGDAGNAPVDHLRIGVLRWFRGSRWRQPWAISTE